MIKDKFLSKEGRAAALAFCEMVDEIGMADHIVIPVWPIETEMAVTHPMTVGMVRTFHDALLKTHSGTFQERVAPWMLECFGEVIAADSIERNHRFLEESLELVQSNGLTQSEAHQLVDYVFNRPVGETPQEIGGVMVTLAALCLAIDQNMHECGERELGRIWGKVPEIRAKQAAKPKHSPLPE